MPRWHSLAEWVRFPWTLVAEPKTVWEMLLPPSGVPSDQWSLADWSVSPNRSLLSRAFWVGTFARFQTEVHVHDNSIQNRECKCHQLLPCFGLGMHYAWFNSFKIFSLHFCLQHETRDTLLGFNMVNYRACKNLWKACVEHHTFFRLDRPVPLQKNFFAHYFSLGSKFRYW